MKTETPFIETRFKPMADRILVAPDKVEEKTKSGIIIPKTVEQERPAIGTVVGLGTGLSDRPFLVQVGDRVMYSKYAGTEIKIDEDDYLVFRESDIIGWRADQTPVKEN